MSIYLRLTTYTTITKEWLYQKYVTHASQAIYKRYPTENFFTKKKKKNLSTMATKRAISLHSQTKNPFPSFIFTFLKNNQFLNIITFLTFYLKSIFFFPIFHTNSFYFILHQLLFATTQKTKKKKNQKNQLNNF
jgi:uncharacterized membrane protein